MDILIVISVVGTIIALFLLWRNEFKNESKRMYEGYYIKERSTKMAMIEKIYGTKEQYDEFWAWCKENLPQALRYFYDWSVEWDDPEHQYPMANFPEEIDRLLYYNCPLPYVKETLAYQYDKGYFERRDAEVNES